MNPLYEKIRIVHLPKDDEPFVVLDKPRGLPSAPLFDGDESALTWVFEKFPKAKEVKGRKEIEHGLVHRIDNETRGLLLIALSQEFYNLLIKEQMNGSFVKNYEASCDFLPMEKKERQEGFPPLPLETEEKLKYYIYSIKKSANERLLNIELKSRFRPFGLKNKEVRPVNELSGKAAEKKAGLKEYTTQISLKKNDHGFSAFCSIKEGYRHQVRCHLAWLGFPVKGDALYNPSAVENQPMEFTASGLSFPGFSFQLTDNSN